MTRDSIYFLVKEEFEKDFTDDIKFKSIASKVCDIFNDELKKVALDLINQGLLNKKDKNEKDTNNIL